MNINKRKRSLLLGLILSACLLAPTIALADGESGEPPFQNGFELYQSWEEEYPEYITGVYSVDGTMDHLVFMILATEDQEAIKERILSQVRDKDSITFVEGSDIPRGKLLEYQQSLTAYMGEETGVYAISYNEMEGRLDIQILSSAKKAEEFRNMVTTGIYAKYVTFIEIDEPLTLYPELQEASKETTEEPAKQQTIFGNETVDKVVICLVMVAAVFFVNKLIRNIGKKSRPGDSE
ncbi:MAG: hypothetical protein IJM83_03305 [Firmicutes bacterium]|nr:hypothetical protein [Bacillota bacterium]